jgi:poly(3-hydroxybutyrate) depolymerase
LRDFSTGSKGIYVLISAPYAGHTSILADFHRWQSLVENLLENGIKRVCITEWKSATEELKNYDIGMYLRELGTCIDDLGGVSIQRENVTLDAK